MPLNPAYVTAWRLAVANKDNLAIIAYGHMLMDRLERPGYHVPVLLRQTVAMAKVQIARGLNHAETALPDHHFPAL